MHQDEYRHHFSTGFYKRAVECGIPKQAFVGPLMAAALPLGEFFAAQGLNALGRKGLTSFAARQAMKGGKVSRLADRAVAAGRMIDRAPLDMANMGINTVGAAAIHPVVSRFTGME